MQWPPTPGPGVERLEAERLGRRAADHVPQVDLELVAEPRHLVDQRDVDVPVGVLQQLRGLGLAPARRPRRWCARTCRRTRWPARCRRASGRRRPWGCWPGRTPRCRGRSAPARTRGGSPPRRSGPEASSSSGRTTSCVVPGYVVDSSTTSCPGAGAGRRRPSRPHRAQVGAALRASGVGTQTTAVGRWRAPRRPWSRGSRRAASRRCRRRRSSTCDLPAFRPATAAALMSRPTTVRPARVASWASGSPTYPSPRIATSTVTDRSAP